MRIKDWKGSLLLKFCSSHSPISGMEKMRTAVARFVSEAPLRLSYGPWMMHVSFLNILNSYLCRRQNQTTSKIELLVILLGGLPSSALAGPKYLGSVLWTETEVVSEPN